MPIITPSADAYGRMLKQLLPPGRLWRLDPDSLLSKLLVACGDELARISVRAKALIEEADPRTTSELLADFERVLDLDSTGTEDERRARVQAQLIRRTRARPDDFQSALAPILGVAENDVVLIENNRADADAVGDDREIYRFYIWRDPLLPGSYNLTDAQTLVDSMAPSHTKGHVIESIEMICDDPFSLCDRDILGV